MRKGRKEGLKEERRKDREERKKENLYAFCITDRKKKESWMDRVRKGRKEGRKEERRKQRKEKENDRKKKGKKDRKPTCVWHDALKIICHRLPSQLTVFLFTSHFGSKQGPTSH